MPYKEISREIVNKESWKIFRTMDEHIVAVKANSRVICHECDNTHPAVANVEDFILEPHHYSEVFHVSGVPAQKEGFSYYTCLKQGMRCRVFNKNRKKDYMVIAIEDGCMLGRR